MRKISVAVPSFNYGKFVAACLESIRVQDYSNYEVLIADGGSKDESVRIIEEYCALDSRFRFVNRTDTGQVDAIIRAFAHSTGDVLCFLNADDLYLASDSFSAAAAAFKSDPGIDLVSFGGFYVDESGRKIRKVRLRYHPLDSIKMMKYRSGALQPATFWTRAVYEAIPLNPAYDYSFDTVFFYEAWKRFRWLERPEKIVAGYRIHGANKSVQIVPGRVQELARFEQLKFGVGSLRAQYLFAVGFLVAKANAIPLIGGHIRKVIRLCVNALAFLSVYRLPSI